MSFLPTLRRLAFALLCLSAAPLLAAGATPGEASATVPLKAGVAAPTATLAKSDGSAFDLAKAFAEKPTVLVFYRGGWCPYCVKHLAELGQQEAALRALGYQVLAISPDKPATLSAALAKTKDAPPPYQVLSDSSMKLARAFGLAFRLDDATYTKYQGYGIDLEQASGEKHHELPVPAVFLVSTQGQITFAYANPDYKVRLSGADLLAAAAGKSKE